MSTPKQTPAEARHALITGASAGLGLAIAHAAARAGMRVTLVARDCTTADSYTKAVSVLGPERGLSLIEETPGAAAAIVRLRDGQIETFESERLNSYLVPDE